MSELPASFLREHRKLFSSKSKPAIFLGAFGKHPGWDDHMEDLGMETESMLAAKEVLYVEGIGGQINSGEWEKLPEADRLAEFDHLFLWKRDDAFLLGKLWSSSDGKGRKKYPMIVMAHCQGIPLGAGLSEILPVLKDCEAICKGTKSADEVRSRLSTLREKLRIFAAEPIIEPTPDREKVTAFLEKIVPGKNPESIYRIFYHLQNQGGQQSSRTDGGGEWQTRAMRARLPYTPGFVIESFLYWTYVLDIQMGSRVPALLTLPLAGTWIDALIGRPAPKDFHALLAKPEIFAITSEIAFQIEDDFRDEHSDAIQRILKWGNGTEPGESAEKKTWFSKLLQ
jgi:hypothetical protein